MSNLPGFVVGQKKRGLSAQSRDYFSVGLALCIAVFGMLLMRIAVSFITADDYADTLKIDAIFSLTVQLILFLAVPFIIYKFYGKRSVKQVAEFSFCGKFRVCYLLAIPIGICVYVVTIGVSSAWMGLLRLTGYNSSSSVMPQTFHAQYYVAELLLTAVLPAVCEEFIMRGGLLKTVKGSFKTVGCIVFCGIAFGLFHQNVRQVLYTSLFGAFAAFLVIRTKSLYPAMIMHFVNNFLSVSFDYAYHYNKRVYAIVGDNLFVLKFLAAVALMVGLVFLLLYCMEKRVIAKKTEVIKDSAFDVANKRVVLMGEFDEKKVADLEMEKEVFGADYKPKKYKPTLRDLMLIIGAGVVALCSTVFTYVWGFFY